MLDPEKGYQPAAIEEEIYRWWEDKNLFHANPASSKPAYSIVIPPPNVTGQLHVGHALDNTLQDILCRFKRMQGYEVLWMPGTDHAGIATQNVVERFLAGQNISRHALGREKFVEQVWAWKEEYGGKIISQLKRLGASCDWPRLRFTMDEGLSRAVREVFVSLYEQGLIYRGDYIINWCPRCQTALSDLESEHKEIEGGLYYIKYPYGGDKEGQGHIVVATTRPETMLGDVAVAINQADKRYCHLPAKQVRLPLVGRLLPIIYDDYVSLEFGTGALKVTPAHDPNDFDLGVRHNLPRIKIMDEEGRIGALGGIYAGLDRFEARARIVRDLEEQGFLLKQEKIKHSVGHCYRCSTIVEPLLSKQWFVRAKPLAQAALSAVEKGESKIYPPMWEKTYFEWLRNIRDWCVSRQIWWGHRIPAWYCDECGEVTVARSEPKKCPQCKHQPLRQEEDVLDTWFSSALWPFSTMGWPDKTPELKKFYPTSCLVTGFDILFFWVARMMMMGVRFMREAPFKDICIHALVRDAQGQKMSKSKGNVMDPLEIIDDYGADAFRFTLAAFAAQGRDIKLSNQRIAGYRNFANKIWNAARFAFMQTEKTPLAPPDLLTQQAPLPEERWILSRIGQTAEQAAGFLDEYRFNDAAAQVYHFIWHEFCDWYLELIKVALNDQSDSRQQSASLSRLFINLDLSLRLVHPFMPFISEYLWQKLPSPRVSESIMHAPWPNRALAPYDQTAEQYIGLMMDTVGAVRNIRGEMGISPAQELDLQIMVYDRAAQDALLAQSKRLKSLARLGNILYINEVPGLAAAAPLAGVTLYVPLAGLVDVDKETARLHKEIDKQEKQARQSARKLDTPGFRNTAPQEVIETEEEKLRQAQSVLKRLHANLERLRSL
ncbi:MAG: valine--tRNA ligase [Desulfarculales bacterium]|jgi:valyl-tRNA synthetase|nr:valine--tRNA ligase [Desulfarculales bacterium]